MSTEVRQTIVGALCLAGVLFGMYIVADVAGRQQDASAATETRPDPYMEARQTMPCDPPTTVLEGAQLVRCHMKRSDRDLYENCMYRVPRESCSDGVAIVIYNTSATCERWRKIWDMCREQATRSMRAYAEHQEK